MNKKLVLLIGLVCLATTARSNKVAECLSKIVIDDGFVGDYAKADVTVANQANTQVKQGRLLQGIAETNVYTNLITSYYALTETTRAAIKSCNPSTQGAMNRCETVHGAGNCESRGPGLANKKCATTDLMSFGHSICTNRCPEGFLDRGLDCYKPEGYKTQRYETLAECEKLSKTTCERYSLQYFVPVCKKLHTRQGPDGCIPRCPQAWTDIGRKCLRPTLDIQKTVFAWIPSDN